MTSLEQLVTFEFTKNSIIGQRQILLAVGIALTLFNVGATAQSQVFAYPNVGQSEEQQSRDRFECHQWSVSQTGFDPTTAPPLPARAAAPPPNPNQGYSDRRQPKKRGFLGIGDGGFFEGGGLVGDAATGAALGAAGGAIAGDAGEGAAIGALASTVFGAISRSSQPAQQAAPPPQQQDYYQQQQAQVDHAHMQRLDQVEQYNRAYGACMRSRDYTVN
ncbi:MAG: hypothetical protein AAF387_09590 [Pseudomonadota bacterium]